MKEPQSQSDSIKWIDTGIISLLFVFSAFAPHSIAVTQAAWLLGMLLWVVRFAFYPPPRTYRTPIDYALLCFFILTGLSTLVSYEPLISAGKLRAASLFTIVYLTAENVHSLRLVRLLAITLVASSMINVILSGAREVLGHGVRVEGITAESPLRRAMSTPRTTAHPVPIENGDTIFEIDGKTINTLDDLVATLASGQGLTAKVRIFRLEWTPVLEVPRRLQPGTTAESQLGISAWTRGRDWRATGFYGHFVTYAESLQLIGSLALGLLLACPRKRSGWRFVLLLCFLGLVFALVLTLTRASWAALFISAIVMLGLAAPRKIVAVAVLSAIPLVLAGALFLQHKRNVKFLDQQDQSTTWRETVWHEGFNLLVSKPRHLLVGVGMDSLKAHWRQWGLFAGGRIPLGHMHSNLLQLALERGVPALLAWLWLLAAYALMLWRTLHKITSAHHDSEGSQSAIRNQQFCWLDRGIVLGALGGLLGFFVSGLVHYNWGDSEVVMILYFIMGMTLVINRLVNEPAGVRNGPSHVDR